jgi:tripartite-type tricarboxylate transporter receptor subunit TctC
MLANYVLERERRRRMKSLRSKALGIMIGVFAVLSVSTAVLGADVYPSRPVQIIIPFAPGGGTDIVARWIGPRLSERLGQPVYLENKAGGGSIVGNEFVAKAEPDGYTLLLNVSAFSILPSLEKMPYDPVKSFTPIAKLGDSFYVLVVHPSVQANSMKEFIALAKQKPGQLVFAASGIGAGQHMSGELLKIMADIDFKIVQFKGAGPALIDLLGGHSHASISASPSVMPHILSGKLRALGTGLSGVRRSVILPNVPTIAEAAGLPGYEAGSYYGVFAPARTPAAIVNRLDKELKAIMAQDEVKKQFIGSGAEVDYFGPTEFGRYIEQDIARWKDVVKKANIKSE